eukprot:Em0571g4a
MCSETMTCGRRQQAQRRQQVARAPAVVRAQAHPRALPIQAQVLVPVIRQPPEDHEGVELQSSPTGAHVEDVPESSSHLTTPTETESHMSTDFNTVIESLETLRSELETSRGGGVHEEATDGVRQRTLH